MEAVAVVVLVILVTAFDSTVSRYGEGNTNACRQLETLETFSILATKNDKLFHIYISKQPI